MKYALIALFGLIIMVSATDKWTCDPRYCTTTKCCTAADTCQLSTTTETCSRSTLNATCVPSSDCDDDCCVGLRCGTASECKALRDLGKAVATGLGTCYLICLCVIALIVVGIIAIIVCIVRSGKRDRRPVNKVVVVE